ncbi:hypothetical protein L618_008700000020 [Rhodococcus rhodochrous J45]|uniref:Uncharacterized protein n=1 Tax=Rhodococcus rhodochrous J45 TaxID=935266 RepID=A0A562D7H0_RHORH|nr:hypothetical protein [Rhodococcus rhodochrous]TWH05510.1 hypothetical protein L618_008700000020 [Rhodococcus rhodochrous J45]
MMNLDPGELTEVADFLGALGFDDAADALRTAARNSKSRSDEDERVDRYARVFLDGAAEWWREDQSDFTPIPMTPAVKAGIRAVLAEVEKERAPKPRQWNDLRFIPEDVTRVRSTDVDGRDHVFVRGQARHGWLWHDTGAPASTMFMHSYAPYTEILGGAE